MTGSLSSSSSATLAALLGAPPAQLLTRDNFIPWNALMLPALRGARVLDLVEGKEVVPEKTIEVEDKEGKKFKAENPDYAAWFTWDQQVLCFLLNSVSPEILAHVTGLDTAAEVWASLKELVSSKSRSRIQSLRGALQNTKKGTLSAEKYVAKKKAIAAELAVAGKLSMRMS
jgi:hypothetical protein